MKNFLILAFLMSCAYCPAYGAEYKVDPVSSMIAFSGTNSGNPFKGTFDKWEATIHFHPNNLSSSKISVTIDTASAKTGDGMYDGTLPTEDWFDVKTYPKAQFDSTTISKNPDGSYTMEGTLKIRDKSIPIKFLFTLTPANLSTPPIKSVFSLTLDRLAFDLGKKSDPKAEWVSREIKLEVTINASR